MVFSPAPQLTVTVEQGPDGPDIHLHAGGQGVWQARMIASLGVPVRATRLLAVALLPAWAREMLGMRHPTLVDWATALRGVNTDDMTTIKLPGGGLFEPGSNRYLGEKLQGDYESFFEAVRKDAIAPFLLDHPEYVNVNS